MTHRTRLDLDDAGVAGTRWRAVRSSDNAARSLADRHYNRVGIGAPTVGPPGRRLTLVTVDERALWQTHYTDHPLDGLEVLRCSTFRNEGAGLSSELILEAMLVTLHLWDERPAEGWLTFVDRSKVSSTNPGYCFLAAGWTKDRTFVAGAWARHLIRLRAPLELAKESAPMSPARVTTSSAQHPT